MTIQLPAEKIGTQFYPEAAHVAGEGYIENSGGGDTAITGTVIEQASTAGGVGLRMSRGAYSYQRNFSVRDLAITQRSVTAPAMMIDNIQAGEIENVLIHLKDKGVDGIRIIEGMRTQIRKVTVKKVKQGGVGIDWVDSTGGGILVEDCYTTGSGTGVRVRHNGVSIVRGEINQNEDNGVGIHLDMASGNGAGGYFSMQGTRLEVTGTSRCGCLIESDNGMWDKAIFQFPQISLRDENSLAFECTNGEQNIWHLSRGSDKHEGSRYIHFGAESKNNTVYTYGFQLIEGFNYTDDGTNNRVISV